MNQCLVEFVLFCFFWLLLSQVIFSFFFPYVFLILEQSDMSPDFENGIRTYTFSCTFLKQRIQLNSVRIDFVLIVNSINLQV